MDAAQIVYLAIAALVGCLLGALLVRLAAEKEKGRLRGDLVRLEAELEAERRLVREREVDRARSGEELRDSFKALAADALNRNNEAFLGLAGTRLEHERVEAGAELEKRQKAVADLVEPIGKSLEQLREHVAGVEKERKESAGGLNQLLTSLREDQDRLRGETRSLVAALRKPSVRGQWGEMTLKRIVELAGLSQHCDFDVQAHVKTGEQAQRPDMVVHLPAGKHLVVDAKTPLDAYLSALETDVESEAAALLKQHAKQVREHVNELAAKKYWANFQPTPDFVVMFLQNEAFLYSALEQEPDLVDYAAERKVIIATPTTLIAVLKSVAFGWRQERLAESARVISDHGAEMHKRIAAFLNHMTNVGKGLEKARTSYNSAVGSLQRSVLPGARKFEELGVQVKDELADPVATDGEVRTLEAPELEAGE